MSAMAARSLKMFRGPDNKRHFEEFMIGVTGEEGRFMFQSPKSLGFFILCRELLGIVPGFFSPTANLNTTGACALIVVVMTHVLGVKFHGIKYIKHFMGPRVVAHTAYLPIEIVGHLSRVLSLSNPSFRKFYSGETSALAILFFSPRRGMYLAPVPMMILGLFTGFIQAFIFCLLAMMYFAGAIEHAH